MTSTISHPTTSIPVALGPTRSRRRAVAGPAVGPVWVLVATVGFLAVRSSRG